ncbi:Insulin-induced gene 1 protein [Apodemus speciosus]|uniref:Insulin-induced gene protein n=1 Tax=Apodemus speciosus TaxID=105296 RepID=A0ABQ0EQZ8_APOSI
MQRTAWQLAPRFGAAEPSALFIWRGSGPGAQPAADPAECHALPRRGDSHYLLLRLVGAPVLWHGSRCCRLTTLSLGLWWTFDRSRSGLGLGITIAFLATLITQFLVYNGVYQYTSPDFLYIRSWLPCIFFSGGVTVGNIGRQLAMPVFRKSLTVTELQHMVQSGSRMRRHWSWV